MNSTIKKIIYLVSSFLGLLKAFHRSQFFVEVIRSVAYLRGIVSFWICLPFAMCIEMKRHGKIVKTRSKVVAIPSHFFSITSIPIKTLDL
jgi:hypothetical protein